MHKQKTNLMTARDQSPLLQNQRQDRLLRPCRKINKGKDIMKKNKLLVVADIAHTRIFKIEMDSLRLIEEFHNPEAISVKDAKRKTVSGLTKMGGNMSGALEKRDSIKEVSRERFCETIAKHLKQHAVSLDLNLDNTRISLLADSKMLGELRKHLDHALADHVVFELPKDVAGYPLPRLEEYARLKGIIE
jgi:protein required for attachment to host cells